MDHFVGIADCEGQNDEGALGYALP